MYTETNMLLSGTKMWKGWKDIVNITALMTFFIRGTSHSPYALRRLSIWFDWNWLKNCWELSLGSIKLIFMHFQTDRGESEVSIIMIFSSIWMLLFDGGQGPENYWVTSIKWEICQLQKKTDTKVRSILIQRIICVECTLQLFKFTCLSLANFGVLLFISTTYTRHISQQHWSLI